MEEKKVKYAIGDQDFKSLRDGDFLYVDKTQYIERILEGNLRRPHRHADRDPEIHLRDRAEIRRYSRRGTPSDRGESYALKFATDPRRLFKIDVNFSSETRRLEYWKILDS